MNSYERKMCDLLRRGREEHGVVATKAEFEAEGTRTDELLRLLEIAHRSGVSIALKVGGCEAIRDLLEAKQFGVRYIIAPMVETPYALTKYIQAKNRVFSADESAEVDFLFNRNYATLANPNIVKVGKQSHNHSRHASALSALLPLRIELEVVPLRVDSLLEGRLREFGCLLKNLVHEGSDLGGHRRLATSVRFDEPVQRALNKVVELGWMQFETIVVIFGNVQFGEGFGCR
jgi:hypothetical protein